MAVAVLLATGCDDVVAGEAAPAQTSPPSSTTTTTSKAPDYSLARLCELISSGEAQELGGSPEGEDGNSISDGYAICGWSNEICEYLVDLPRGRMFAASASVLSAGEGKCDAGQVANQLTNLIIPRVKDQ